MSVDMDVLEAIAAYLAGESSLDGISIIMGDPDASAPEDIPALWINPYNMVPSARMAAGPGAADIAEYTFEVLLALDLSSYGPPVQTSGQTYYEQPGWRALIDATADVVSAMRANITLSGAVASSKLKEVRWGPLVIDNKSYRAARMAYETTVRRARS